MAGWGVPTFRSDMELIYLLAPVMGYLCGSVPFGYLVARKHGVNILKEGSGNIGATNVSRVLGKKPGLLVFGLDLVKGCSGVWIPLLVMRGFGGEAGVRESDIVGLLGGIGAILGHNFSCWLKFRGGKGIATTAGVLLGLTPLTFLILISGWAILFKLTRYVSMASIIAAFSMPFVVNMVEGHRVVLVWATAILGFLAVYRHKENIKRLLNGTENRFAPKSKKSTDSSKVSEQNEQNNDGE